MFSSFFQAKSEGGGAGGKAITCGSPATAPNSYDFDEPEVDYDRGATPLYMHIENKEWDAANQRVRSSPDDAKTWVSRKDKSDQPGQPSTIRWRLLPIHASCVFRSPVSLIEALLEAYPDAAQLKDVSSSS